MRPYLLSSTNFSQYQSAYKTGHSTETALLEVLDGVYTAADDKQISVLIGLAAFDTVDHSLLLERLHSEFAVTDTSLDWLRSYLVDRVQFVKMDDTNLTLFPSTLVFHKDRCSAVAVRCLL